MKKIFFLLVVAVCFSCNSDDDGGRNTSFHSPSWIQGTWYVAGSDLAGVRFTSDDYCTIASGNETCYKNIIEQSDLDINIEGEVSTDTDYEFNIIYRGEPGVERDEYLHYRKISETQMVSIVDGLERLTYNKQ
ncbi:hypothetical protein [Formosa haliotis]|uniref:hypothetical protein n=1 Tax=Formosa haliotis TaxID=1555194 RepID=UPI000825145C|nr:hypothetical protein [Formosa haliotis]